MSAGYYLLWRAGSTVLLMASTSPSGQPSRKQSETSKSKQPGYWACAEFICSSWDTLKETKNKIFFKRRRTRQKTKSQRSTLPDSSPEYNWVPITSTAVIYIIAPLLKVIFLITIAGDNLHSFSICLFLLKHKKGETSWPKRLISSRLFTCKSKLKHIYLYPTLSRTLSSCMQICFFLNGCAF